MGDFWSLCAIRLALGLGDTPGGLAVAGELLAQARANGHVTPAALGQNALRPAPLARQALLALLATAAPGTPLAEEVQALVDGWTISGTDLARALALLDEQRAGTVHELLGVFRHRNATSARLLNAVLHQARPHPVLTNFRLFVTRATGAAPSGAAAATAEELFGAALECFAEARPRSEFLGHLYADALTRLRYQLVVPPGPNQQSEPWFEALEPGERHVLTRCAGLTDKPALALYLHLYGGLTSAQISAVFQDRYGDDLGHWWDEGAVIDLLAFAWRQVL